MRKTRSLLEAKMEHNNEKSYVREIIRRLKKEDYTALLDFNITSEEFIVT